MRVRKSKHVMLTDNVSKMSSYLETAKLPQGIKMYLAALAVVMDSVALGEDSFLTIGGTRKRDALLVTVQIAGERASEGVGGLDQLEDALNSLLSS